MVAITHTIPMVPMLIWAYALLGLWCVILYSVWFSTGNSLLWLRISWCECCSLISLSPRQQWHYGLKKRVRGKALLLCHVFVAESGKNHFYCTPVPLLNISSTDVLLRSVIFAYCNVMNASCLLLPARQGVASKVVQQKLSFTNKVTNPFLN